MKNYLTAAGLMVFNLLLSRQGLAQGTCRYLAYEGFDYPSGTPLHLQAGGTGWERAWEVQNENSTVPGYQSAGIRPLSYRTLPNDGRYAAGGKAYLNAGRKLDLSSTGPFVPYLAAGAISSNGKTLWFSGMVRKEMASDTPVWTALHGDNASWYVHSPRVGFGFFGTASKIGSNRFWSLQVNDTVVTTPLPVTIGESAFFVIGIDFDSVNGTRLQLFVNPEPIGSSGPPAATLTRSVPGTLAFRSVGVYLGADSGNGAVDELRLANSWACATPTPDVLVDLPPRASIELSDNDGTAPFTVTLDGRASTDAEAPLTRYQWSFGDGSPGIEGSTQVTHVYKHLGNLRPSLTVTDASGQKNTTYGTVTVRNTAGTFPCLSSPQMIQRPSCGKPDGKFQVILPNGAVPQLRNGADQLIAIGANNTYSQLAPGPYRLTVSGAAGCTDRYALQMDEDRSSCPGWTPDPCQTEIGMNIDGVNYWSRERAFRDFMKSAGTWIPYNAIGNSPWSSGTLAEMPTDADGYPSVVPYVSSKGLQAVRGIISADGHLPAGDYVLLYEGTGTIQMMTVANVAATGPGRITFTVQPSNRDNIWFNITASSATDHVRNIRIVKADEEGSFAAHPFSTGFVEKLRPFQAIRFLNWSGLNPAPTLDQWSDRTSPTRYTQSGNGGVAFEYFIELGNLLNKDIWLTVPHTASDAYVTEMAQFFRDRLAPHLTIYLEYSDEVWNFLFAQARWVEQNGPGNLNYARKYAERATHLFRLWHGAFGQDSHRVKRVLNVQAVNPWYGREVLAHTPSEDFDYLSPAWYFGYAGNCERVLDSLGAAATANDVLNCVQQTYASQLPSVRQNYLNASFFGKHVINYEGGQSITTLGVVRSFQAANYAAQIDAGIVPLYEQALNDLRGMGSKLAMAYMLAGRRDSKFGSWGHLEDIDQPGPYGTTAPKYQALIDNLPQCPPPPP